MTTTSRLLALALLLAPAGATPAAPPAQFLAWGSAGPELPAAPAGWREQSDEAGSATWTTTDADRRQGYVLFAREPFVRVSPREPGFAAEQVTELRAAAARDEYEPVTFCLHALADLADVRVEVGALRGRGGAVIPAENVDVRVVRCIRVQVSASAKTYRLEPYLLERRSAFAAPAGTTRQVWLTLKVPVSTKPGEYTGTITVRAAGRPDRRIPLRLRVWPFVLPPAPIDMAICYPRPPASDDMLRKQLIDVREHGCASIEPAMSVQIASRDRTFGDDDVQATVRHCRRMLRARREVFGQRSFGATFGAGHQIICHWDQGTNWFAYWPHSPKIDAELLRAIDLVCQTAKAAGANEPLRVYPLDEAGAHNLLDEAAYYYALIRRKRPHLATWTTIGGGMAMGIDELGALSQPVEFLTTNRLTPKIARALVARHKPYGVYNGAGHTPAGARFFYGLHGWKTGAEQVLQWCYHFGNGVFEAGGIRRGDEGYAYLAADGPLPSLMWEAVREGIDDYRTVSLLWRMIGAGKSAGGAPAKLAADAAGAVRRITGATGWGFQALDSSVKAPPPHPSTMRKWRRELAGHIVKLRPLVADEALAKAPARCVSPFDLPWAPPPAEKTTHGPELLPVKHFKAKTPWTVQAWKGKGTGTLDEAVRYRGQPAMRIDVPAGAADAVTVLVWGSWGGNKLSLPLAGGRSYELSATVRYTGRSTPPTMRIALPSSAAGTRRDGESEPNAAGWRRVHTRVEARHPAVPKYLAVWVQGPGTVWVAGLSLREVIPPPVVLTLDQQSYDPADAVAVASITVNRHRAPARVRFSLATADGRAVATRTVPFAPRVTVPAAGENDASSAIAFLARAALQQCRVVFSPSALAPGDYKAKVDLLDDRHKPIGTATRAFRRLGDKWGSPTP